MKYWIATLILFLVILLSTLAVGQDSTALSLKTHIALPGVDGRMDHFGVDLKGQRLFVSALGNHTVEVLDVQGGRRLQTLSNLEEPQGPLPIGEGRDQAEFDPETHLVFSSNGEGTVTVIQQESPDKYSVLETVKTAPGARTVALDLKTHKIFLPVADIGPAPAPTAENLRPRGSIVPGTFRILIFGM
jgi:DNA-binding beta-propeller fold protein YncE